SATGSNGGAHRRIVGKRGQDTGQVEFDLQIVRQPSPVAHRFRGFGNDRSRVAATSGRSGRKEALASRCERMSLLTSATTRFLTWPISFHPQPHPARPDDSLPPAFAQLPAERLAGSQRGREVVVADRKNGSEGDASRFIGGRGIRRAGLDEGHGDGT